MTFYVRGRRIRTSIIPAAGLLLTIGEAGIMLIVGPLLVELKCKGATMGKRLTEDERLAREEDKAKMHLLFTPENGGRTYCGRTKAGGLGWITDDAGEFEDRPSYQCGSCLRNLRAEERREQEEEIARGEDLLAKVAPAPEPEGCICNGLGPVYCPVHT